MIRNYVLIALRLFRKNKLFSFINILGLSTGIACCILISLYVQDEFAYEKGFSDHDRIFRINTTFVTEGKEETSGFTSPPIAIDAAENFPEVETSTRVVRHLNVEQHIVRYNEKLFFEKNVVLVDSTFLDVFPYALAAGDAKTALDGPSSALVSEAMARKLFGDAEAVDEQVIINSGTSSDTFRITGVVKKGRFPSHVDADIYMTMNSNGWGRWVMTQTTWVNNNLAGGYLKLRSREAAPEVERRLAAMLDQRGGEELRQSGRTKKFFLQRLGDLRLYSGVTNSRSSGGSSITYVYITASIGAMILLLACINFMNLTTARSAQRAGEVGVRKSMGAFRSDLVAQFLGESLVVVSVAVVLAFAIVLAALPLFNETMQKDLSLNGGNFVFIALATLTIAVITGVFAGSYPAFFLSSLKPAAVLKGNSGISGGSQWLRKGLVVFQFVITIALICSIVIVFRQMTYIQSKSLGFDTRQTIMIPMRTHQASARYSSLRDAFEGLNGVERVSATTSVPSTPLFRDWLLYKAGTTSAQSLRHEVIHVDEGYFDALGVRLVEGRDFDMRRDNIAGDTAATTKIVVNEESLRALGIPLSQAVGSTLYFEPGAERYEFTVIGVVRDFHQFSLHRRIGPMIFILPSERDIFPYIAASVSMEEYDALAEQMGSIWNRQVEDAPFEIIFVNENLKTLYAAERRVTRLLTMSTGIALLISCLGLYGLSVFVAERRTREIGIRKVVGASVGSIVGMLSREYIALIILSFLMAVPISYWAMDRWLSGFAYHVDIGLGVFLVTGVVSFGIAWLTVSIESVRAARRNPVDAFRVQ